MAEATRGAAQRREAMARSYETFVHRTAMAMVVVAPALLALPPRKLDLYALALAGSFVASADYLTRERTGRGILGHVPGRRRGQNTQTTAGAAGAAAEGTGARPLLLQPPSALEAAAAKERWGVVGRSSDDDEAQGWKERRWREDRDKMAQGQGYGSIILDQIWEVWNWGNKNKAADVNEANNGPSDQRQQDERARRRGGVSDNG
jgi:hypothetical protein